MIKDLLEKYEEIAKLKLHLEDYCFEIYIPDNTEALQALIEEGVEYAPIPSRRLFMEELNPKYDEMYNMSAEDRRAYDERSADFDMKYNKYQLGEYMFEEKYLYYDLENLPSIVTVTIIDDKTEDIFNTKNSKRFNSDIIFRSILNEIETLDPRIAYDVIERFEYKINEQRYHMNMLKHSSYIRMTEEERIGHHHKKIDDYQENIVLLYELIDFLRENYKPKSSETTSENTTKTTTIEKDEGPTSVHDLPEHILKSLIEHKLVHPDTFKWIPSHALCTYFIYNYYKHRGTGLPTIGFQMFGIKGMAQKRTGYKGNKHGKPLGFEIIDKILDKEKAHKRAT